jgi:ADP-ribose pyrophosphatase
LSSFERLDAETVYSGRIVDVRVERFRHADGEVVSREIVRSRGAVGILAHDEEQLWLVRQPRETVGRPDLLEIPAGRLDVDGEEPIEAARRELAEEVGLGAGVLEPILTYYSSAGFTDERVHLFHATALFAHSAHTDENERIDVVQWPLAELPAAIGAVEDAKTLIALMWLGRELRL